MSTLFGGSSKKKILQPLAKKKTFVPAVRNACAKEEKDGCNTKQECTAVLGWNTCSNARPDIIVAVGDSSLVVSTIGNCLDEERVFDIQTVLDNINQIHSDAAGIEQAEERLQHVLGGVFA